MGKTEQHSPRWQRTHSAIQFAYAELLDECGPDDVTVSQIASRAGIHRKTFYLHYDSVEELYDERVEALADRFGELVRALPLPFDYYDLSRAMFDFYSSDPKIERIFSGSAFRQMADDVVQRAIRHSRSVYNPYRNFPEAEQELINMHVVYSSNNVWRRWVMSGKKVPRERAIELLGDLLEHGVATMRAPYNGD